MGVEFAFIVWITPKMQLSDGSFPASYYALVLISYCFHQVGRPGFRRIAALAKLTTRRSSVFALVIPFIAVLAGCTLRHVRLGNGVLRTHQ